MSIFEKVYMIINTGGYITRKFAGDPEFTKYLLIGMIVTMVVGYIAGSINGAEVVSVLIYRDDIRKYGSKNAGATNMVRTFGIKAGILTAAIDIIKTVLCVYFGFFLSSTLLPYVAGLFCMIGHAYPLFFQFKGGKGVVVAATLMLITAWPVFIVELIVWLIIVIFSRYVSVASIIAAVIYPFVLSKANLNLDHWQGFDVLISFVVAALIIFLHRSNITRLREGTENRIGKRKNNSDE